MSFNLYSKLTKTDLNRFENYIQSYGIESNYIGSEEYLKYWGKEKIKLYKLLGNQFIYKFPFEINKSQYLINEEISKLMDHPFMVEFHARLKEKTYNELKLTYDLKQGFNQFLETYIFLNNSLDYNLKFKEEGKRKGLSFQAKMKPIRGIPKILDYFEWNDLKDSFEDFRIKHSMIFNEKILKGNLCLSINPMDFLSLSDNNENWLSCFSMINSGCYQVAIPELMNSNNVIVAYVESKTPWNFSSDGSHLNDIEWEWSSKRFRQLIIVNKDIILNGKGYPYQNSNLTKIILNKIKELAEKNLGWHYSFGPEPYQDMRHIGSKYRMDLTRKRIHNKDTFKYNIIIDTHGAYNDWFNDHDGKDLYWCYRNKVKKTKLINVSGKAPCLCCGGSVIEEADLESEYYEGSYNDRYEDTSKLICPDCRLERRCDYCDDDTGYSDIIEVDGRNACEHCFKEYAKICPDCGAIFIPEFRTMSNRLFIRHTNEKLYTQDFYSFDRGEWEDKDERVSNMCVCQTCLKEKVKDESKFIKITTVPQEGSEKRYYDWLSSYALYISRDIIPKEDVQKYFYKELKSVN